MRSTRRRTVAVATATLALLTAAACGSDDDGGGDSEGGGGSTEPITVWTTDTLPDRVAATEAIIADFTEASGIERIHGRLSRRANPESVATSASSSGYAPARCACRG